VLFKRPSKSQDSHHLRLTYAPSEHNDIGGQEGVGTSGRGKCIRKEYRRVNEVEILRTIQ
jgi:hypothetical protein